MYLGLLTSGDNVAGVVGLEGDAPDLGLLLSDGGADDGDGGDKDPPPAAAADKGDGVVTENAQLDIGDIGDIDAGSDRVPFAGDGVGIVGADFWSACFWTWDLTGRFRNLVASLMAKSR